MVRNIKGGSKTKKQARKNIKPVSSNKTRFAIDKYELYACCTKMLGNGRCNVICQDGVERICIIRNKFKGRGKRGNVVSSGTLILVGLREFENQSFAKKQTTDLLEVYSEQDKKLLTQSRTEINWSILNNIPDNDNNINLEFVDETEYMLSECSDSEFENENENDIIDADEI